MILYQLAQASTAASGRLQKFARQENKGLLYLA
jgi:hypothetical protein